MGATSQQSLCAAGRRASTLHQLSEAIATSENGKAAALAEKPMVAIYRVVQFPLIFACIRANLPCGDWADSLERHIQRS